MRLSISISILIIRTTKIYLVEKIELKNEKTKKNKNEMSKKSHRAEGGTMRTQSTKAQQFRVSQGFEQK